MECVEWFNGNRDGTTSEAMIYIMNYGAQRPPMMGCLGVISDGYREFGFNLRYLSEAVRRAKRGE